MIHGATTARETPDAARGYAAATPAEPRPLLHPAESAPAAAVPARPAMPNSLATLFTTQILQDGEIVLMIVKPSIWFMLVTSMRFLAMVAILAIAAALVDDRLPSRNLIYIVDVAIFLMAGRITWAILQWMGHVYVLTDRRIITLGGVFMIDVYDCPLRKIARTRIVYTTRERIFRLGTIQIIPSVDDKPDSLWQMIAKPAEVHEMLVATINKSKQGGLV